MAPDAEIYAKSSNVDIEYGTYGEHYNDLSWFIDNYCDVINCSFGVTGTSGNYDNGLIDSIYDYIIRSVFISIVASAGNDYYDHYVYSLGLGFNVITVGGVVQASMNSTTDWIHAPEASYISYLPTVKPNISAPYKVFIPNCSPYLFDGTSFAAPMVTAAIALLCDKDTSYAIYPESINSIILATGKQVSSGFSQITNTSFDNKTGAGILNIGKMLSDTVHTVRTSLNITSSSTNSETIQSQLVFIGNAGLTQIGMSWLQYIDYNGVLTNIALCVPNYDIEFKPTLQMLNYLTSSSNGEYSNIEFIRKSIPTNAESYYLIILKRESLPEFYDFPNLWGTTYTEYLSISYDWGIQ